MALRSFTLQHLPAQAKERSSTAACGVQSSSPRLPWSSGYIGACRRRMANMPYRSSSCKLCRRQLGRRARPRRHLCRSTPRPTCRVARRARRLSLDQSERADCLRFLRLQGLPSNSAMARSLGICSTTTETEKRCVGERKGWLLQRNRQGAAPEKDAWRKREIQRQT